MPSTRKRHRRRPAPAAVTGGPPIFLRGSNIYCRPYLLEDVPRLQRWVNDPGTRRNLLIYWPLTELAERKFVESSSNDPTAVALAIVLARGDTHIGAMSLREINWRSRTAKFGIMIGEPAHRGAGHGTEATWLMLRYAFNTLHLNRVELGVYDFNAPAIRVYEKLGFRREGVAREDVFVDGRYRDVIQYAILAREFVTP